MTKLVSMAMLRSVEMLNSWKVGCFYGNGEDLIKKAYADSEESGREYERVVKYVESILADELNK